MLILRLVLGDKERDLPLSCVVVYEVSRLSRHSRSLDENRGSRKWSIDEIASENDPGTRNDALRLYVRKVETVVSARGRPRGRDRRCRLRLLETIQIKTCMEWGPPVDTRHAHVQPENTQRIFTCQPCSASSRASRGPRTSRRRWSRKSIGCTSCAGGASAGRACR